MSAGNGCRFGESAGDAGVGVLVCCFNSGLCCVSGVGGLGDGLFSPVFAHRVHYISLSRLCKRL